MATQVVDTDGHIFEKDDIMLEYIEPPYRGMKLFTSLQEFQELKKSQQIFNCFQ